MMRRVLVLILTVALGTSWAALADAAEDKQYAVPAAFNGKTWQGLERVDKDWAFFFKVCVIRGIYEGAYSVDPQNAYQQYGPWVSTRELAAALDRFYQEDRNLNIPVAQALILQASTQPRRSSSSSYASRQASSSKPLVSMETKDEDSQPEIPDL